MSSRWPTGSLCCSSDAWWPADPPKSSTSPPSSPSCPRARRRGSPQGTRMATTDDPQVSAVEELTEPTGDAAAMAVAPELMAQTFGEYVRAWVARIRGGDAGALPVIAGLILISILFQSLNSKFLTAGNLVNLLIQSAAIILLAMAEVYVLLLGEIDLSAGFVAGIGGVVMAELLKQGTDWPWWAAIAVALLATAAIG